MNYNKLTKFQLIEIIKDLNTKMSAMEDRAEIFRLAHDLYVHKVELEVQNEELREAQMYLEQARDRYADLYDFAPVGYVTFDSKGFIQEINLMGAAMLGGDRKELVGKPFSSWLTKSGRKAFHGHLEHVCSSTTQFMVELELETQAVERHFIQLISTVHGSSELPSPGCRSGIIDITYRKHQEEELHHSRQILREMASHHESVREDERKRLAREIHDELGQSLTALRLEVSSMDVKFSHLDPAIRTKMESMLESIDRTIGFVRNMATELRPALLDVGLVPALEWLLEKFHERTSIDYDLDVSDEDLTVANKLATAIFRIVQESLTNVIRHAQATVVLVTLLENDSGLELIVKDNGLGIDRNARKKRGSFGLVGIEERVLMLGGELVIESKPGKGTTLKISLPVESKAESI